MKYIKAAAHICAKDPAVSMAKQPYGTFVIISNLPFALGGCGHMQGP